MKLNDLDLIVPDGPGGSPHTTIQAAITAASDAPNAAVWIRADYSGEDTYINPKFIQIYDNRKEVVPIVLQKSLLAINVNTPQTVTNIAPATSLYNIAMFSQSYADGTSGQDLLITIGWVNVRNVSESVILTLHGSVLDVQQENYVFLTKVNSAITISTAFAGAYAFHYDLAAGISIIPVVS